MPDHPRLGEFRDFFAGRLGTFEEFPTPATFDAVEVIDSEELFSRIVAKQGDQVDGHAFLKARLVDLLIGDWDRPLRQWRWIRYEDNGMWYPFPEDRDHSFCRFDGAMMGMHRDSEP